VTFSVVARDPATGELGIAVSSCILAVGRAVPSARPGVGVVAVQARSRRGLGPSLLAGLADGADPAELVRAAAHAAEDVDRQIAVLDATGRVAAHTGRGSFPISGHLVGDQMSVQGNMLASPEVLPAMAQAWTAARGDLPDRLLAALTAGQDGVRMDLRVDDSGDPVAQLRMLRNLQRAYDERDYETLALFAPEGARDLYAALAASQRGDRDAARTALEAMRTRPGWSAWLAAMAGDARLAGVSQLLG
jgi:uncharacterized Ntn-hydrolase superfamily protein